MQAHEIRALGVMIAGLRDAGDDVVIVSVETHGPDHDMHEGCVGATVRIMSADGEQGGVIQADRDAAARLLYIMWKQQHGNIAYPWMRDEESATLSGKRDRHWAVQYAAKERHLILAKQPTSPEDAA